MRLLLSEIVRDYPRPGCAVFPEHRRAYFYAVCGLSIQRYKYFIKVISGRSNCHVIFILIASPLSAYGIMVMVHYGFIISFCL